MLRQLPRDVRPPRAFRAGRVVPGILAAVLLTGCGAGKSTGLSGLGPTTTNSPSAVQNVTITTASMSPTLHRGERVTFSLLKPGTYRGHAGDIVLFTPPSGWDAGVRQQMILRVIAVGGQTVECRGQSGDILVNGKPLDEPYIQGGSNDQDQMPFRITVPPGRLWMMGDNRNEAADSRFHVSAGASGTVPAGNVSGVLESPH